jgi:hypothetical protein
LILYGYNLFLFGVIMNETALTIGAILLLPILAFMPGLIGPWQLWHSMVIMFVLGFGGLFVYWSRG